MKKLIMRKFQHSIENRINFQEIEFSFMIQIKISRFAADSKVLFILRKLATLLTNKDQIEKIQTVADQNGLYKNEELKAALRNARFNLQWADKNVPIIKKAVQQML